MKYLSGLMVLVVLTSYASAADMTCTVKSRALVGVSASVTEQAYRLLAEDTAALNGLVERGVVIFVPVGTEFRADPYTPIYQNASAMVPVRRQGSPDTFYTKRSSLNCHTGEPIDQ
jgi:hypothetical protein